MKPKYFVDANFWIYLNILKDDEHKVLINYIEEKIDQGIATNMLILDELLYISKRKYSVPYLSTLEFWKSVVVPISINLPLNNDIFTIFSDIVKNTSLKPADALHAALSLYNEIPYIISEDSDFDKISGLQRIWIDTKKE